MLGKVRVCWEGCEVCWGGCAGDREGEGYYSCNAQINETRI